MAKKRAKRGQESEKMRQEGPRRRKNATKKTNSGKLTQVRRHGGCQWESRAGGILSFPAKILHADAPQRGAADLGA